jgi:hypothetical protein
LPDVDVVPELLEPFRRADKSRNQMAASECLFDEFETRAAGRAQHHQSQALLIVSASVAAKLGITLHSGYR